MNKGNNFFHRLYQLSAAIDCTTLYCHRPDIEDMAVKQLYFFSALQPNPQIIHFKNGQKIKVSHNPPHYSSSKHSYTHTHIHISILGLLDKMKVN